MIAIAGHANASDSIQQPPAREAVSSPAGNYVFVIEMNGDASEWMASGSTGTLSGAEGGDCDSQWTDKLPHAYRPRFAFVNDAGFVVLLDQWINVAGPHAVTIVDPSGKTIASHGFYDVANAVGLKGREIVSQARYGAWMSSKPEYGTDGDTIEVMVGKRRLMIQISTGELSVNED